MQQGGSVGICLKKRPIIAARRAWPAECHDNRHRYLVFRQDRPAGLVDRRTRRRLLVSRGVHATYTEPTCATRRCAPLSIVRRGQHPNRHNLPWQFYINVPSGWHHATSFSLMFRSAGKKKKKTQGAAGSRPNKTFPFSRKPGRCSPPSPERPGGVSGNQDEDAGNLGPAPRPYICESSIGGNPRDLDDP